MFNPSAPAPAAHQRDELRGPAARLRPAGFHFNKPSRQGNPVARRTHRQAGTPAVQQIPLRPPARPAGPEPCARCRNTSRPNCTPGPGTFARNPACPASASATTATAPARRSTPAFSELCADEPLPVQDPRFFHNGGSESYPLHCQRFDDPAEAWFELDRLHQHNTPTISSTARTACTSSPAPAGQWQTERAKPQLWLERNGRAVTLFSREAFEALSAKEFEAELANFTL